MLNSDLKTLLRTEFLREIPRPISELWNKNLRKMRAGNLYLHIYNSVGNSEDQPGVMTTTSECTYDSG